MLTLPPLEAAGFSPRRERPGVRGILIPSSLTVSPHYNLYHGVPHKPGIPRIDRGSIALDGDIRDSNTRIERALILAPPALELFFIANRDRLRPT
jgi:hypothetical protein